LQRIPEESVDRDWATIVLIDLDSSGVWGWYDHDLEGTPVGNLLRSMREHSARRAQERTALERYVAEAPQRKAQQLQKRAERHRQRLEEKISRDAFRSQIIDELKTMGPRDRFLWIAKSDFFLPVGSLPPSLFRIEQTKLQDIPQDIRLWLLDVCGKRRGAWRQIRDSIRASLSAAPSDDEEHNQ
jgi:hypothetical protein